MVLDLVYAHLIREADEEGRAQTDDWLDAPLTREELAEDEQWAAEIAQIHMPVALSEDEMDERQRAFMEAQGRVIEDGSSG